MTHGGSRADRRRAQRGRAALVALGLIAATAILTVWYLKREGTEPAPAAPAPATATEAPASSVLPAVQPDAPVQSLVPATTSNAAVPDATSTPVVNPSAAAAPERRFAVQVIDGRGDAVPEATLRVESVATMDAWFTENQERLDKLMKEPDGPEKTQALVSLIATRPKVTRPAAGQVTEYTSGADGWCRFTTTGDVTVSASKHRVGTSGVWSSAPPPSFSRHRDEPPPVAQGEERRLQLTLVPPATISGRALDRDGRPLSQASVMAESTFSFARQDTNARTPEPVQADESGSFAIEVDAPGEFDVQAQVGDLYTAKERVSVGSGDGITIELRVAGAFSVSGTVVGEDGRPVPAARLTLDSSRRGLENTVTDADGRFRFPLTSGGEYEIAAHAKGLVQETPANAALTGEQPDASVVIRMVKAATIAGVVHWDDGTPVEGASVEGRAQPRGDQPELSWLSTSRAFRLSATGEFTLDEIHPEYVYDISATLIQPFARAEVSDVAPGTTGVELVLEREQAKEYSLTGQVLDSRTGNPITEYELAHGSWMRGLGGGDTTHVRDDGGRFEIGKLSCFDQALEVRAEGYPPKTVGPLKPTDPPTEITIRLEHMGGLAVHTVDDANGDVPGASLIVYRAASEERPRLFTHGWRAETGQTGHVTWEELPPGSYFVQAESGDMLSDLTFVQVVGGQPNEVAVELVSSLELGTLEVTVRDEQGQPMDGARVRITNMTQLGLGHGIGAGLSEEAEATSQGGLPARITGLLPAEYWVWPDVEDHFISPDWVVVPAGQVTSVSFDVE